MTTHVLTYLVPVEVTVEEDPGAGANAVDVVSVAVMDEGPYTFHGVDTDLSAAEMAALDGAVREADWPIWTLGY